MYTNLILFALGMLGVFLHNLVSLNKINKDTNGNAKLLQYLKVEVYSILINVVIVIVAIITKEEFKELHEIGAGIGLGFVAIGYMGQSLLIWKMGRFAKAVGSDQQNELKQDKQ